MRTTPEDRYHALVVQLLAEPGATLESVGEKLGVTHATISLARSQKRGTGGKAILKAIRALEIDSNFFYDESLGESPDYRDFVGGRPESRIERDDETLTAVEEFLRSEPRVTAEEAALLRDARLGSLDPTPAMIRALWLEMRAAR